MPHRLALNGYLLLDDTIHRGINRTAEKIEQGQVGKRFNLTKKKLAFTALGIGTSTATAIDIQSNNIKMVPIVLILGCVGFMSIENALRKKPQAADTIILNPLGRLQMFAKLRFLFVGIWIGSLVECIIKSKIETNSIALIVISIPSAIAAYLISDKNGALDRFKHKVREAWKALGELRDRAVDTITPKPEPIPQTVEVK